MPQASRRPIVRPQTLKKSTGNLRPTRKIDRIRNENENENETENETERVTSVLKKFVSTSFVNVVQFVFLIDVHSD